MRRFVIMAALIVAAVGFAAPARAAGPQPSVVSADPVDWTPHVLDGTVYAIAVVGDTVVVGGDFDRVATADGGRTLVRHDLFAFRLGTGEIVAGFAPRVDGTVYALAAGPAGTVYAGGAFTEVDGARHAGVARLEVSTGAPVPGFRADVTGGGVSTLVAHGTAVYVGGSFAGVNGTARPALARVSGDTGALVTGFDARIAQQQSGRLRVERLALTNDGSRLAATGTFTRVGGQVRTQLAVVSAATGAVSPWYTTTYQQPCDASYHTYLRGVDFAPDGSYLVVVTTGHMASPTSVCDSVARFDLAGGGDHRPAWVNRTGGNSLFSVASTGAAVYVGGHQEWLNNPQGNKSAGPGAVSRPGISAVDPATGKAMSWNPTRTRGVGVQALVTYPAGADHPGGLLVGSDTDQLGHEYHGRVGAFPLA